MHTRSFGNDEISNFIDDHESQSFPIFSFFLLINMNAEFEGIEYPCAKSFFENEFFLKRKNK